jgi:exodeoxyribonuclease VII small subunit
MPKETTAPTAETTEATETPGPDLTALGYEQARDELMDVVRRLETGGLTLEESLAAWERGEALAKHCQAKLDGARARLDAAAGGGGTE